MNTEPAAQSDKIFQDVDLLFDGRGRRHGQLIQRVKGQRNFLFGHEFLVGVEGFDFGGDDIVDLVKFPRCELRMDAAVKKYRIIHPRHCRQSAKPLAVFAIRSESLAMLDESWRMRRHPFAF